jgi:hypothetical protein
MRYIFRSCASIFFSEVPDLPIFLTSPSRMTNNKELTNLKYPITNDGMRDTEEVPIMYLRIGQSFYVRLLKGPKEIPFFL